MNTRKIVIGTVLAIIGLPAVLVLIAVVLLPGLEYPNCANDAAGVHYTIRGGGHAWPGGKPMPKWLVGPTSRSIDATSQIWAFFRAHQLVRD
jgi:poly(3-hydroxybutyrate) depolymerase